MEDYDLELDNSWVDKVLEEDKEYDDFYSEKNNSIAIYKIYVNCKNSIIAINKDNEKVFEAAALDLISPEPTYAKKKQNMHPLFYHPRVFYSPHVAALTDISQKKIANFSNSSLVSFIAECSIAALGGVR